MSSLPIIAIIGPTNAGKSTLLNRLARKNIAITAREEGTTRDNVTARLDDYILIDTAGLKAPEDDFEASIQSQITEAIDTADLILVLLDATIHPDDRTLRIVREAQKSKKPYLIALNKSDLKGSLSDQNFRHFGEKTPPLRISATTGQGITDLQSSFLKALQNNKQFSVGASPRLGNHSQAERKRGECVPSLKLALIGRPNVGKSTLFNTLANKQQAITSSRQGTTRDINRVEIKFKGQTLEFLDTAGLRRQGRREVGIEKFSALRTLSAIEESDICLLLIDATEPHVKLDQSLAGQITEAGKSIIIIITKSDLVDDTDTILNNLEEDFNFLPYAPVIITSSVTGKNLTKIFDLTTEIYEDRKTELKTSDLNKILEAAVRTHPPAGLKNTHPKLRYMVQTDTAPPWFVIYGSELQLLHWSYKRRLERLIREHHPFIGTPIFLSFKNTGHQTHPKSK